MPKKPYPSQKAIEHREESSRPISSLARITPIVDADDVVEDAARLMHLNQVGSILVSERKERGKPIGIFTEWDLLSRVVAKGKDASKTRVREVMSSPVISIDASSPISDALRMMIKRGIRRLAVLEDGVLIGVVGLTQLIDSGRGRHLYSSSIPIVEPLRGFICPYCNCTFKLRSELTKHLDATHLGTLRMLKRENGLAPSNRSRKIDYTAYEMEDKEEDDY
jgi:CBS domain-containing protein